MFATQSSVVARLRRPSQALLLLAKLVLFTGAAQAATPTIPFSPDRWEIKDAELKEFLGQPAITGTAWLKDTEFENGIIEVDLAADRQQAYPAIVFRRQSDGEYEHVYFRPHRAGFYADAVQYSPVFNGVAGWQLYSGPGFTAGVTLPENQWVHIRLEVSGTQAKVFVGAGSQPVLEINDLKHGLSKGTLGLQSPKNGSVHFANFSCVAKATLPFEPPEAAELVPGVFMDWEISPSTRASDLAPERYLDGQSSASITWQPVKSEASGLVDIARSRKPVTGEASKVWARTSIHAQKNESIPINFGYSDDVSIYLNGRILFSGKSGFKRRDPSFLGIIGWNDTIYLPLQAGENELVLLVSEKFGGWGFMVRDLDAIYHDPSLKEVWDVPGLLGAPESVAYDDGRKVLYVSNFSGQCISKIGLDGTIVAAQWVGGLKSPTGLKFFGGRLYAVERSGVAEIDPESGSIVARHPIPDAVLVNDLAIGNDGVIYVTDTSKDCIFRLSGAISEVWFQGQEVARPNGILVEKDRLLVGVTADGTIKTIDLKSKSVTTFLTLGKGANMDGLVPDGAGGYLLSDYYGRVYRADAAGRKTLLLDRRGPRQYAADFAYIPELQLLVIPSLFEQRLTAFRLALP